MLNTFNSGACYISLAARHVSVQYRHSHCNGLLQEIATEELKKIKDAGTWKSERVITSKQGPLVTVQGYKQQNILNFCSNNYLGLAVSNEHTTVYCNNYLRLAVMYTPQPAVTSTYSLL
jgi:7-keto-8-aminopelargonate synthetase-like enzyme